MRESVGDSYYYIFDSREQRTLAVDRRTGEELGESEGTLAALVEHVADARSVRVLQQFARWCARQTGVHEAPTDTVASRLWTAAQARDDEARLEVRREVTTAIVRATALGLPRHRPNAARLLAAYACTHPDALHAAVDAAHMSARWAEFEADAAGAGACRQMRQRQIDRLLDVL